MSCELKILMTASDEAATGFSALTLISVPPSFVFVAFRSWFVNNLMWSKYTNLRKFASGLLLLLTVKWFERQNWSQALPRNKQSDVCLNLWGN